MIEPRAATWRWISASTEGSAHRLAGLPCQDRCGIACVPMAGDRSALVAAVADGAGSARFSEFGAAAAVRGFLDSVAADLDGTTAGDLEGVDPKSWLKAARQNVLQVAATRHCAPSELASTLLGVVVTDAGAIFVQIGDGVMVYRNRVESAWDMAFWPQHGQYRNETYFLTDRDAIERAGLRRLNESLAQLALTSDGIEDLCLDRASRQVFQPFFDHLFKTVTATGRDPSIDLDAALLRYLRSDRVDERTDDDRTLILASRAEAEA